MLLFLDLLVKLSIRQEGIFLSLSGDAAAIITLCGIRYPCVAVPVVIIMIMIRERETGLPSLQGLIG